MSSFASLTDHVQINAVYDRLFKEGQSLSQLKDAALGNRLIVSTDDPRGAPGRSLAWKLFLLLEEPLPSAEPVKSYVLLDLLKEYRQEYHTLLAKHAKPLDWNYETNIVQRLSSKAPIEQVSQSADNLEKNNPLSLDKENPWREWFAALEVQKTVSQDVERTFPDISFFRDPQVQSDLTNILFVYAVEHPSIGYRQGMHEILAPLYYAVSFDAVGEGGGGALQEICAWQYIAADSWALFTALMRGLAKWYQWRESPDSSNSTQDSSRNRISPGPLAAKQSVSPVIQACDRIQSQFLRSTDPLLYDKMQAVGIEPQIYIIRWLRLLFTREFPLSDALKLWDGLFACDDILGLAEWMCVAMLIRIRHELIAADYMGQLTILLRYPSAQTRGGHPIHHASLLLRQAITLQTSPTPGTSATIVMENRNVLVLHLTGVSQSHPNASAKPTFHNRPAPQLEPSLHSRQQSSHSVGLPEMIARGFLERGESLGLNKTIFNAVSELRRNIPDFAVPFVRSPNASDLAFPMTGERSPEQRSLWEPRTRFEMEREIAQLKSANKKLGDCLTWIHDTLQDSSSGTASADVDTAKALDSLLYVRDVLIGKVENIDDGKLKMGAELSSSSLSDDPDVRRDPLRTDILSPRSMSAGTSRPRTSVRPRLERAVGRSNPSVPKAGSGVQDSNDRLNTAWRSTRTIPTSSGSRSFLSEELNRASFKGKEKAEQDPLGALS